MEILFYNKRTYQYRFITAMIWPNIISIFFLTIYFYERREMIFYKYDLIFFVIIITAYVWSYFITRKETRFWIENLSISDNLLVYFKVNLYNSVYINQAFKIDEFNLKLKYVEGKGTIYKLVFNSDKFSFEQREILEWNGKKMQQIVSHIDKLKLLIIPQ